MEVTKIFYFNSAHKLHNYDGCCKNLHGHTYILHVTVKGKPNFDGMVMDFSKIKDIVNTHAIKKIDHCYINEMIKQPTAENIIVWIWDQLIGHIPLSRLILYETSTSYVEYDGVK